jgi:hypothetical protein
MYRLDDRVRFLSRKWIFLSSPPPYWLWDSQSLLSNGKATRALS